MWDLGGWSGCSYWVGLVPQRAPWKEYRLSHQSGMPGEWASGAGQRGGKLVGNTMSVIQNSQVGKMKGEWIRDRRRVGGMGMICKGRLPFLWLWRPPSYVGREL